MNSFFNECENTINRVQDLLRKNDEWILRYEQYINNINSNIEIISTNKKRFHEWSPLYLYMNITNAKGAMKYSLRYQGQDVAELKITKKEVIISTEVIIPKKDKNKKFRISDNNQKFFSCDIILKNCEWRSKQASNFRSFFRKNPKRINEFSKHNEEHRIESILLTEFSKKSKKNKIMTSIQPVRLLDIARFQMPTPLKASDLLSIAYSSHKGGGIDILARMGREKLCVMELKDENRAKEPPKKAIQQALSYATFIHELLRSKSGKGWWKLFGFGGSVPSNLSLYVACVMPYNKNLVEPFEIISIPINDSDRFDLHFLFFEEENQRIKIVNHSF